MSLDLHTQITNKILADLEEGVATWHKPWLSDSNMSFKLPVNIASGKHYQGINIPLLWSGEYPSEVFGTFQQWSDRKEVIRKGEKGNLVVFFKQMEKTVEKDNGELDVKKIPMLRAYTVFNKSQLKSWKGEEQEEIIPDKFQMIENAEQFISNTGAKIIHAGDQAYYKLSTDTVHMPIRERFVGTKTQSAPESYYATELHELTHWTGHKDRLNRDFGKRFGDKAYAFEELIAEQGAAFLCASLEITDSPRPDHAQYIGHWIKVLKDNKTAIVSSAGYATKAFDYLTGFTPPL